MSSANEEPYRSWHGLPWPGVESPAAPHSAIEPMNVLLSLPPIVMVTSWVSLLQGVELRCDARGLGGEVVLGLRGAAGDVGELRAGPRGDDVG